MRQTIRSPLALAGVIASVALALVLPGIASGAALVQVRKQLLSWHLQPTPLFPSRLPPSFGDANVTLDRFSGVDFDVEFGKPNNGCQRVNATDLCVELRRASASALDQILHDPENLSTPRRLRIGRRSVWFVDEGRGAGGWELAWHEQGRTYSMWEWTADARAALGTLSPLVKSLSPLSVGSAGSCPDVTFIGARGSGEPADRTTHEMGSSVSHMADRLDQALKTSGLKMSRLPVIYPALAVDVLKPTLAEIALMVSGHPLEASHLYYEHNLKRYIASIDDGVSQTVKEADGVAAHCPDTMLVMAGYSQGAMVIHQAERQLDDQRHAHAHDAIIGTLLLADGDRVHDSRARLVGSAPRTGEGIRTYLHAIGAHDVDKPWTTAEVCNSQDIVCDFSLDHVRSIKRANHAVDVHVGYLAHDTAVLDQAVDWLAAKIMRTVGPWGLVGRLRLDTASATDVTAVMGPPERSETGNVDSGYPDFYAMGYDCGQGEGASGLGGPTNLACRTVFFINQDTSHVAAFATKSSRFIGPAGIHVGEAAAQAERRLHVQGFSGCGQGIQLGLHRNRAEMLIPVAGGTSQNGVLHGGRITEFDLESNARPIGLLFC